MMFAIEIEKVGPNGYITRLADARKRVMRFPSREAAQIVADAMDEHYNRFSLGTDSRVRYEVIEIPDLEYIAERDPRHGAKP